MPDYKYHCSCGNDFSIFCKMSEYQSNPECPKCHNKAERKISDMVCGYLNCDGFYGKTSK